MCLTIHKNNSPIIVKEPVIVYKQCWKITEELASGLYYSYEYIQGMLNTTKIRLNPFLKEYYDTGERAAVKSCLFRGFVCEEDLRSITKGFHFCFDPNRFQSLHNIAEFIIPEGSMIYKGLDETLGVTNQIIFNKWID